MKHIVVVADPDFSVRAALRKADDLARPHGASVQVVHALVERGSSQTAGATLLVVADREPLSDATTIRPLPSLVRELVLQTTCPTLVVKSAKEGPYRVVLVATQSAQDQARGVIEWARALGGSAECHVVHVYGDAHYGGVRSDANDNALAAPPPAPRGTHAPGSGRLHVHLVGGEPAHAILGEADRFCADLVVLGRGGAPSAADGRAMGRVALRIVNRCRCDVLVLP